MIKVLRDWGLCVQWRRQMKDKAAGLYEPHAEHAVVAMIFTLRRGTQLPAAYTESP